MKRWIGLAAGALMATACAGGPPARPAAQPLDRPDERVAAPKNIVAAAATERPASNVAARGSSRGSDDPRSAMDDAVDATPKTSSSGGGPREKDYLIPAAEILGFQFLLNQFDRRFVDHHTYATNAGTMRRNLRRAWVIDKDPFSMNQFGHPYTGSLYHGFARSAGLSYWEALGYDFLGSAIWEVAGETDPPSRNDQITTSFAGSFLGEALFRTASWVLRGGKSFGRQALAAAIQPSSAVNRGLFGSRFDAAYPQDDPAVLTTFSVGMRRNATLTDLDVLKDVRHNQGVAAFSIDYGLPGKPGYEYDEPFDYFHLEATGTTSKHALPENISVRGLLYGAPYESGKDWSGVWGLYGTYDYFSPEIFKVSSTGLGIGTTGQWLLSDKFALQTTGILGGGFTAAGTTADRSANREYHYGGSPQAVVSLRVIWDDVAMFDLTANDYVIPGGSASGTGSRSENILRAQISLTFRVSGPHAVGIQFVESRRSRQFTGIPDPRQAVGALSVFYTYLGDEHFGVVRK